MVYEREKDMKGTASVPLCSEVKAERFVYLTDTGAVPIQ